MPDSCDHGNAISGIYWPTESLSFSQEGLYSVALVIINQYLGY
jgi:hypothetical protein